MANTDSIAIFVSCHKDSAVFDDPFIHPIQVGCALSKTHFDNYYHDDDGADNISEKNHSYCEVTAQYWVWKNIDSDYYGFFHYRRYLSMLNVPDDKKCGKDGNSGYRTVSDLTELASKYGYTHQNIKKIINENDIIVPFLDRSIKTSNYDMYVEHHFKKDIDFVLNILKEKSPEMYPDAMKYLNQKAGYYCNMFIMRKDIFQDYCIWLFDILRRFEDSVNIEDYNTTQYRVVGYLAERLCGIYINYLKNTGKYRFKEVQIVNISNTAPIKVRKKYNHEDCVLVLAANDYYSPHVSALLQSIIDNSCNKKNYDIIIFSTDISSKTIEKFNHQIINNDNISVRVIDVSPLMKNYKKLPTHGHFKIETYYRFFIQDILEEYDKALYLDSDMVVNCDLADLYSVDLKGHALAACYDVDTAGLYNGFEPGKKKYMDDILKIQNPYTYFQAGTILFNLSKIRGQNRVEENLKFAMSRHWELLDQDVLNYIYQGDVELLDPSWNYMIDMYGIRMSRIISLAPTELKEMYYAARNNPKIIHYAGPQKPWDDPTMDFAEYYWRYAKKTPFYEELLMRIRKL